MDSGSVNISRESPLWESSFQMSSRIYQARSNLSAVHARGRLLIMTNIPSDVESDTVVRGAAAHAKGVH